MKARSVPTSPAWTARRRKPSKALVAALVVVSAAHAGVFAYLAYQKFVPPITDYVESRRRP